MPPGATTVDTTKPLEPVVIETSVEAYPRTEQIEIPGADWASWSPTKRQKKIDQEVDETIGNAGGSGFKFLSGGSDADLDGQVATAWIPATLLTEAIETLEQVGCQFAHCDGPTLEPVDMVTCHACATLAKLRKAAEENR